MSRHATREELIARFYGLEGDGAFEAHLADCAECQAGLRTLERQRAASAEMDVPVELLANQRREILAKLDRPSKSSLSWIPATAAAALVLTLALVYERGAVTPTKSKTVVSEVTDESLLAEISAVVGAEEPRAAEPIRGLFEDASIAEDAK